MKSYPEWLHVITWIYLIVCSAIALWMTIDFLRGHRQKMWIMYLVWPITAMYFGPVAAWMYTRTRSVSTASAPRPEDQSKQKMKEMAPTREQATVAVYHCGAGCSLGDIIGEVALFASGGAAMTFIGDSEFATKLVVDFGLAYLFGIFFQYFTIVPMRGILPGKGILASMRADTISILAFEVGMMKGGFVFGARHGRGVATCRTNSGWSAPAFFTITGGSWGAQIGVEAVDVVMMVMNDQGVQDLLSSKFKLGGGGSVAAGPVGRQAQASTDYKLQAQVLMYSRARGVYAGLNLNGAVIQPDEDTTRAFYGKDVPFRLALSGELDAPRLSSAFLASVRESFHEARAAYRDR